MLQPARFEIFTTRSYPLRALAATLRLIHNKEDTSQVYRVTSSLDGPTIERSFQVFRADPRGVAILAKPRELRHVLADREWLRGLPEKSLGRAYLDFVESEGLSPEGFQQEMDESGETFEKAGPDRQKFIYRLRHTHDLLHVLTGYGRDMIGELSLLAFTRSLSNSLALGLIVALGQFKARQIFKGYPVSGALKEGGQLGRAAGSLMLEPWEELLTMDIEEVRKRLNIGRPEIYLAIKEKAAQRDIDYRDELTMVDAA